MSQIGVAIVPGSMTATWIPHGRSSRRSESEKPSSPNFDAAYAASSGTATLPPIELDVHDPPARGAQLGQERLRHGDLPDQVDLELAAEVVDRLVLERRRDGDARVVDEAGEAATACLLHRVRRRRDRPGVGDVEDERRHAGELALQALAVLRLAHAGEDIEALAREPPRARLPDSAGGAGDNDRSALCVSRHRAGLCHACWLRRVFTGSHVCGGDNAQARA